MMDFEPCVGKDLDAVCNMLRRRVPWTVIPNEVAKCDLVCSNCHRSRTYFRRMGKTAPGELLSSTLRGDYVVVTVPSEWRGAGSNRRPLPYECTALPLSYPARDDRV